MADYKAIYICSTSTPYEKGYYTQHWKYRGHEYMVTAPTGWDCSTDYLPGGYNSKANQHKREQAAIDAMLDSPKTEPARAGNSAQKALDELFNFFETGEF